MFRAWVSGKLWLSAGLGGADLRMAPCLPLVCLFVLLSLGASASQGLYFFDLLTEPRSNRLLIKGEPQVLVTSEQLENDAYSFPQLMKHNFDAPIQSAVSLLRELNGKRCLVFPPGRRKPFHLATFQFFFALRKESGRALDQANHAVDLLLLPKMGMARLAYQDIHHDFFVDDLENEAHYLDFLTRLAFPRGLLELKLPKRSSFLIDMYYSCSGLAKSLMSKYDLDDQASHNTLYSFSLYRVRENLGTTACRRRGDSWEIVRSGHLNFYRQTIQAYSEILGKIERGESVTDELEAYIAKVPDNAHALSHMVDAYLRENRKQEAYELIAKYKPLFRGDPGRMSALRSYEIEREEARLQLLQRRNHFSRDHDVRIKVLSPTEGDLVAGRTTVMFELKNTREPLLQVDCFVDDALMASIAQPPFRVPVKFGSAKRTARLKVVAYFENETYQETVVALRTMAVGEQDEVRLLTVKAVVQARDRRFLMDLRAKDFLVTEGGKRRKIHHFERLQAPLRVAILVDTSNSMSGGKLYKAQFAVNNFLQKLGPDDSAAVYTFDKNVLKLSDFTNRYDAIQPVMLTLSPHYSTSLNKALLVAHQDLLKHKGIRAVILLSDGKESSSSIKSSEVFATLSSSSVMVYPILLNLANVRNDDGEAFMREVSRVTGSNFLEAFRAEDLDDSFQEIYRELKSFYLMSFYSNTSLAKPGDVHVRVTRAGTTVRFIQMSPEELPERSMTVNN